MPGPRPKSPAERELTGNAGHKAKKKTPPALPLEAAATLPTVTPETASTAAKPPAFLTASEREAWNLAAPALQRLNLLTAPDVMAFARYCSWLAEYFKLTKQGRRRPIVERTAKKAGKMDRLDKGFQARLAIDKRLQEYEDRFGMNPRERQAILSKLADGAGRHPVPPPTGEPATPAAPSEPSGPVGFLKTGPKTLQ